MKIYVVNENYNNGESYEDHDYYELTIGVFDNKEGAQKLIDHIFKVEKQRLKGFVEVLPDNFKELNDKFGFCNFCIYDYSGNPRRDERIYLCDNFFGDDDRKEIHQFYIDEEEINEVFDWYKRNRLKE